MIWYSPLFSNFLFTCLFSIKKCFVSFSFISSCSESRINICRGVPPQIPPPPTLHTFRKCLRALHRLQCSLFIATAAHICSRTRGSVLFSDWIMCILLYYDIRFYFLFLDLRILITTLISWKRGEMDSKYQGKLNGFISFKSVKYNSVQHIIWRNSKYRYDLM